MIVRLGCFFVLRNFLLLPLSILCAAEKPINVTLIESRPHKFKGRLSVGAVEDGADRDCLKTCAIYSEVNACDDPAGDLFDDPNASDSAKRYNEIRPFLCYFFVPERRMIASRWIFDQATLVPSMREGAIRLSSSG